MCHGQAAVECGFSETIAISQRGWMSKKTVEGQNQTKCLIRQYGSANLLGTLHRRYWEFTL